MAARFGVPSLLSECQEWIERCRASRRKIARDEGQQYEQQARQYEDDRIESASNR